ncbi:MAG: hypothetical protein COA70_06440 [Planctomycetota bacterium]|nr:MAG: hypothetical protein COA70_06440 [Planctomycetota bacterium]
MSNKTLQVMITAGAEDPHKARQGLEAALTAAAMGVEVHVFLTLRGAFWAEKRLKSDCYIPGCESIPALIVELIALGVNLETCSACAIHFTGSCETGPILIDGVKMGGLTTLTSRTIDGMPTITF